MLSHPITEGLLDTYPTTLDPFSASHIDKAIQALLFSVTAGATKRIISNAKTAFESLIDLRRNCAQNSSADTHR